MPISNISSSSPMINVNVERDPPFLTPFEGSAIQRIEHLQSFLSTPLSNDERSELLYLIIVEKCELDQIDVSQEMELLTQLPYSPLTVAYKVLSTLYLELISFTDREDLVDLQGRLSLALARFDSFTLGGQARERYSKEALNLQSMLEVYIKCPIAYVVHKSLEDSLKDHEINRINAIFLTVYLLPTPEDTTDTEAKEMSITKYDLAGISRKAISLSFLDESIVNFWLQAIEMRNTHIQEGQPSTNLDFLIHVEAQTTTNDYQSEWYEHTIEFNE